MYKLTALASALAIGFILMGTAFGAAPKTAAKPAAPSLIPVATCNDGKVYSHATGEKRGACAFHGGVASWSDGTPVKSKNAKGSYR